MRIVVTGVGGFIGGQLLRHWSQAGHDVLGTFHRDPPENLPNNARVLKWNLLDPLIQSHSADLLVHAAACSRPDASMQACLGPNILGVQHVAEFAARERIPVVYFLSSISLYGRIKTSVLRQDDSLDTPAPYGLSKLVGEKILEEYKDHFATFSLRLPGILGPHHFGPWLGKVAQAFLENRPVKAFNPRGMFNNLFDIADLARLIEHLSSVGGQGRPINVAASEPEPLHKVLASIQSFAASRSEVTLVDDPARPSFVIDTEIMESLGFTPSTTQTILDRYLATLMQ